MDYRLELVVLPVSDVDGAKTFYTEQVGFSLDVDTSPVEGFRILHLVVNDIVSAREELVGRGVEVGEIRHMVSGDWTPGPDPEYHDYASFADFSDPDGNVWVLQEVPSRERG